MRLTHLCAAVAALAAPAILLAARPMVGETILSGCRQGECAWLRVLRLGAPTSVPQGVLRPIEVRRGISVHLDGKLPNRARDALIEWEARGSTNYAFCSTRRPAYAFESDGELIVHFFNLFDLGGYQYNSAQLYMRLCHGRMSLPNNAALRRLGYRPGTRSEQVEARSPEVMTRF
jgi:hypothetical protein